MRGQNDGDRLFGGNGDDVLIGGEGQDDLYGEGGIDTLTGNQGIDFFFAPDTDDVITDFDETDDRLAHLVPLSDYIGLKEDDAILQARLDYREYLVVERDGEAVDRSGHYCPAHPSERVNFTVVRGRVTEVTIGDE